MFGISAYAEAPFASLAGVTVVVALTGVQASGAVGAVVYTPLVTVAITWVEAVGAVGNVIESSEVGLSGVQAAGEPGSIGVLGVEAGIQGVAATGSVGTVTTGREIALTGVEASGAVGDVTETNNPTEDGVVAIGSVGSVGSSRTVAITGVQARGQVGTMDYFYWTTIDDSETPNWQNVEMTV